MNGKTAEKIEFLEEQLIEARQALFAAKTVREIKFIQTKIKYLSEQFKKLDNGYRR